MFEQLLAVIQQNFGMFGLFVFLGFVAAIKWKNEIKNVLISIFTKFTKSTFIYSPKAILKSKLTYWIDFKIDSIHFADRGREMIFKDLLKIQMGEIRDHIFDIENTPGFNDLNRKELYELIVECQHDMAKHCEETSLAAGIPAIVVEKFNKWHRSTSEYIIKSAEYITQSPVYRTNQDAICALYLLQTAMLEITIMEAERTLTELNGELTGVEYKGVIVGD